MGRPHPGRRTKVLAGAALVALVPVLSACSGSSGQVLAQEACVHVHRSISDWRSAEVSGTPAQTVSTLQREADEQLRDALPLAADANSDDGSWNALMTAISESATVDENHLIPSLDAQCSVADANENVNPDNPQTPSGSDNGTNTSGSSSNSSTTIDTANVNPHD
ncbi:MAG TPA: hypothetical protein VGG38_07370 [Acidimicrobiales bacterium]